LAGGGVQQCKQQASTNPPSVTCYIIHQCVRLAELRPDKATHLLEHGYDTRTVKELLGRSEIKTIMIYTNVLNLAVVGVKKPADLHLLLDKR
jgi:integrase